MDEQIEGPAPHAHEDPDWGGDHPEYAKWRRSLDAALDGVLEKLYRADDHLELLNKEWRDFIRMENGPYDFVIHIDPQSGDHLIYAEIVKPPPPRLSAIVGDVLHNLRSALDHLAWALVERAGGKPGRHTFFPLCDTEGQWLADVEHRRRGDDRPSPLTGIDPGSPIWTFIQEVQPYKGAAYANALRGMRILSNADKHRTLLITGVYPDPDDFAAIIKWNPDAVLRRHEILLAPDQPLKDGTKVAALNFDPSKPDPEVCVKGELGFDIAFSDGRWDSDRPRIYQFTAALRQYIEYATGLWLEPPQLEPISELSRMLKDAGIEMPGDVSGQKAFE